MVDKIVYNSSFNSIFLQNMINDYIPMFLYTIYIYYNVRSVWI